MSGRIGRASSVANVAMHRLRQWDFVAAQRPDDMIAISSAVRARILKTYRRESHIVFPPLREALLRRPLVEHGDYYVMLSRLVPYKRVDLAVQAFAGGGRRLVIVGTGPLLSELKRIASANVTFTGWVDDSTAIDLLAHAKALVFPGEEDFGIVPVEAQAVGCPVIAYNAGGVVDTVTQGETGIFFREQTTDALREALATFEAHTWEPRVARRNAERFAEPQFLQGLRNILALHGVGEEAWVQSRS